MAQTAQRKSQIKPGGFYGVSVAARVMGVSRGTMYNYIHQGFIRREYRERNGKMLPVIAGIDIIAYINKNTITDKLYN